MVTFLNIHPNLSKKIFPLIVMAVLSVIYFIYISQYIPVLNIGDGLSIYLPANRLLTYGNLNFWSNYNDKYDTIYFTYPYTDVVIKNLGEIYPTQFVGTFIIYAIFMYLFGSKAFYYVAPIFSIFTALAVARLSYRLNKSYIGSILVLVFLFTSPLFIAWSVLPQNIMISTFFVVLSYMFFLDYLESKDTESMANKNLIATGLFTVMAAITRYPHALLAFSFFLYIVVYIFLHSSGSLKQKFRYAMVSIFNFLTPIAIVLCFFMIFNLMFFKDALFVGYFYKNYIPNGNQGGETGYKYYLASLFTNFGDRLYYIGSYVTFYFIHSESYFTLFLISWLCIVLISFGIFQKKLKLKASVLPHFVASFLLFHILLLSYYGSISNLFWFGGQVNVFLAHFRYLLPTYVFLPIFPSYLSLYVLKHNTSFMKRSHDFLSLKNFRISSSVKKHLKVIAFLSIMIISFVGSVSYHDFSGLHWLNETDSYMQHYSYQVIFKSKIPKDAVILYGTRWPLLILLPKINQYHWFYYLGVPPSYRFNETYRVVYSLLKNNETVLIFSSKYNLPEENDMLKYLNSTFILVPLRDTYFKQMDALFYLITMK